MIRYNKTVIAGPRPTPTSRVATAFKLAFTGLLILTSLSACRGPKVINADQTLIRIPAGQVVKAPCDGWFMTDALYQRYRRAVADKILEEQTLPVVPPRQ